MNTQTCVLNLIFLVICLVSVHAQPENWTRLVPLESSRNEAELILGKPAKYFSTYGIYDTEIGRFVVWYSDGKCLKTREGTQWRVAPNLVTSLRFTPTMKKPISDYETDLALFIGTPDPTSDRIFYARAGDVRFYDVYMENGKKIVYSVAVRPTADKEKLRCKF